MFNHAPKDYICPFCLVVKGIENEHVQTKQADILYKDDNLYLTDRESSIPEERIEYANRLKNYLKNNNNDWI